MKKMSKRFLCLILALALCTAMMLPGFAATAPQEAGTNSTYDTHNLDYSTERYTRSNYLNRISTHTRIDYAIYWCKTHNVGEEHQSAYVEGLPHTGYPCVCGYGA